MPPLLKSHLHYCLQVAIFDMELSTPHLYAAIGLQGLYSGCIDVDRRDPIPQ